jgi:hypothetical protein
MSSTRVKILGEIKGGTGCGEVACIGVEVSLG